MKTPLLPGKWSVKLLTLDGYLLAEVKMLVLPLERYQGKFISQANMLQINAKSFGTVDEEDETLDQNNEIFQRRKLQEWIDSLAEE